VFVRGYLIVVLLAACSADPKPAPAPASPAPASRPATTAATATSDAAPVPEANRPCPPAARLPACPVGTDIVPLATVLASGSRLFDRTLAVRGPLRHSPPTCLPEQCSGDACDSCEAHLVMASRDDVAWPDGAADALLLESNAAPESMRCSGDATTLCCPTATDGVEVVAIGRLRRAGRSMGSKSRALVAASLCAAPLP
jgi:hypothetical protein